MHPPGFRRAAALMAFLCASAGPLNGPALDILVNQTGFEPTSPKVFRAQAAADFAGDGTFSVQNAADGSVVHSGTLVHKGGLWNKFYWEGDFSSFVTPGDYTITGTVGADTGTSYAFTIQSGIYLSVTGSLAVQWFWTQRCGNPNGLPGWFGPCHRDDGILQDGTGAHHDAVGGWHDAGDYMKFPHGFAGDGLFGLLWLYESNRAYYDAIDLIADDGTLGANGIPDIVDECLHQARWLAKMVEPSGHAMKEVRHPGGRPTFVRPEADTNNVVDGDDRLVVPGDEATPQEMTVCAPLIKMHRVLASRGMPTEDFRDKALAIWNHRVALAIAEGGHNNLGNGAMQIWAGLDLFAVTGLQDCYDRAAQHVSEMAGTSVANPTFFDSINYAEGPGYELGAMAWFARNYPATPQAAEARAGIQALMTRYLQLADDPIGLIRRDDAGVLEYFPTNSNWNGFFLGINRLYLFLCWAAIESYQTIGDPAYLRFAMDQYNWVMGANYDRVCMMHGAGDFHLPSYHHRYAKIPGHEGGIQPGVVPNGYVRVYSTGLPNVDLSGANFARYQSNECWLPNNGAYAMALSAMNVFSGGGGGNQPPTVSITDPPNGSTYLEPATITGTATASDSDGTVVKVEFFSGATLLGEDTAPPFTLTAGNVPAGTYTVTARATDDGGATATSPPVTITVLTARAPDNPAGTVNGLDYAYYQGTWNALPDFSTLTPVSTGTSNNFTLTPATQGDNFAFRFTGFVDVPADGVYTFFTTSDDGSKLLIGSTTVVDNDGLHGMREISGAIALRAGKHALTVTFFEKTGGEGLQVAYSGPGIAKVAVPDAALFRTGAGGGNQAPTVSITNPANGASFTAPTSINIAATAADADGTVVRVDFFQGVALLGQDTTPSDGFNFPWNNVAAGSYSLTARATDNAGATATSSTVNVTVTDPGGGRNQPPTVGLTSPTAGQTFTAPATVALAAGASDADGTVVRVEFYQGTTFIGQDATAADGFTFSWTGVSAGTYALTAIATDDGAASTTSAVVSITVSTGGGGGGTNVPPTVTLTSPTVGQTYTAPASIALTATASDSDGSIVRVEFYAGANLLGQATASPYTFNWTGVAAGTYSLTARATDNAAGLTISSAASVTVNSGAGTAGDADGDALPDAWETQYFGNLGQNGSGDPDADGLLNQGEYAGGSNPTLADSDADGMRDGGEVAYGLSPTNGDQDANGRPDGLDDWDADGIDNQTEVAAGTPPGAVPGNAPPASGGGSGGGGGGGGCFMEQRRR